jgi:hypothetical protein
MRKYKYKVVRKHTRLSAAVRSDCKYFRKYLSKTNVYAMDGTLGIFVFDRKYDAETWEHYMGLKDMLMVVKVIPIGRGFRPKIASMFLSELALKDFYKGKGKIITPPKGTICYPGVFVVN